MLLSSDIFIFLFFPLLITLYFLCNKIHLMTGKMVLVIGSLIFYAYADWRMVLFLLASVIGNYFFTYLMRYVRWRKVFLAVPLVANVGLLLLFKYTGFVITNLNLFLKTEYTIPKLLVPLGISFITF